MGQGLAMPHSHSEPGHIVTFYQAQKAGLASWWAPIPARTSMGSEE